MSDPGDAVFLLQFETREKTLKQAFQEVFRGGMAHTVVGHAFEVVLGLPFELGEKREAGALYTLAAAGPVTMVQAGGPVPEYEEPDWVPKRGVWTWGTFLKTA